MDKMQTCGQCAHHVSRLRGKLKDERLLIELTFPRKGLKKWHNDKRTSSFLVLLEKLEQMSNPPRYFFLENVVGFEESTVHRTMANALERVGYNCQVGLYPVL